MWKGWIIINIDKEKDIHLTYPFKGYNKNDIKNQMIEFLKKDDNLSLLKYDIDILFKSSENSLLKPMYLPFSIVTTDTSMISNLNDRYKNILVNSSYYLPQYANR